MTNCDRRGFLVRATSSIAAGFIADRAVGASSLSGAAAPPTGGRKVYITIRGLCVFIQNTDDTVDIALMNHEQRSSPVSATNPVTIHEHAARLVAKTDDVIEGAQDGTPRPGGLTEWTLRGFRLTMATRGPRLPTSLTLDAPNHMLQYPWQSMNWLLDLRRAFPAGKLPTPAAIERGAEHVVPTGPNAVRTAAGIVQLSGGKLESWLPSVLLGHVTTWQLKAQAQTPEMWEQGLTDQALFALDVPDGTDQFAIERVPLGGGTAKRIALRVHAADAESALTLAVDHDFHHASNPNSGSSLDHNVVFYDIFENGPLSGPTPTASTSWSQVDESLEKGERTFDRLRVNNGDPYCNMGLIRRPRP